MLVIFGILVKVLILHKKPIVESPLQVKTLHWTWVWIGLCCQFSFNFWRQHFSGLEYKTSSVSLGRTSVESWNRQLTSHPIENDTAQGRLPVPQNYSSAVWGGEKSSTSTSPPSERMMLMSLSRSFFLAVLCVPLNSNRKWGQR